MNDDESHIISEIEIELTDKTHAAFLRQKVELGLTEDERARLEYRVEESRITISGPENLLRRVGAVLSALETKQ